LPDPTVFLAEVARKAGVDMSAYNKCVASGRTNDRVKQSIEAAQGLGFSGTPSFQFVVKTTGKTFTLVGAQPVDVFSRWIDTLLAGKEPPQAKPPEKPELPFWAKAEGLRPDPKRPGLTIAGDHYKGNPDAKLVLVEFGDFQCAACQRHARETQPLIDKQFIDTGELLWVVKHFPLRSHDKAAVAGSAAECAGDQGKFWAMHDLLFEAMERWSDAADPDQAFLKLAAELRLDTARFGACLAGRRALERVVRDMYDGQGIGIRNVPTFILLKGGRGTALTGSRSADEFAATLRAQLNSVDNEKADARADGSAATKR
jgi:protein-disulfide isomerase